MLGVMEVREAIETAQRRGFDLVEIAPKAHPPTCKIMDYGKWKFDLKKKEKTARKKQVKVVIKEIQVRPRTDEFDLNVKIKKAREFLLSGYKVKLHLRFSGREIAHKDIGLGMIERVAQRLKDLCLEDIEKPKMERRSVLTLFSPDPIKIKDFKKKNPPKTSSASPPTPSSTSQKLNEDQSTSSSPMQKNKEESTKKNL